MAKVSKTTKTVKVVCCIKAFIILPGLPIMQNLIFITLLVSIYILKFFFFFNLSFFKCHRLSDYATTAWIIGWPCTDKVLQFTLYTNYSIN